MEGVSDFSLRAIFLTSVGRSFLASLNVRGLSTSFIIGNGDEGGSISEFCLGAVFITSVVKSSMAYLNDEGFCVI